MVCRDRIDQFTLSPQHISEIGSCHCGFRHEDQRLLVSSPRLFEFSGFLMIQAFPMQRFRSGIPGGRAGVVMFGTLMAMKVRDSHIDSLGLAGSLHSEDGRVWFKNG